ncbi:MAG: carboxypeptidase PM20D1 [Candidatus Paceibacteria bacterium]|jgi:carboxypeptidase PM20D1
MKKRMLWPVLALAGLAGLLVTRALLRVPRVVNVRPAPTLEIDTRRVIERLGSALRIQSVAVKEPDAVQEGRLQAMFDFVLSSFAPLTHQLQIERYPRSLVLRWEGSEPNLAPLLLLAHLDVVPVQAESEWSFPPYSGKVVAGSIWGRGALDDKGSAMAMLEAVEILLAAGVRPRRGVILALGLDEELGGDAGAFEQAARFEAEGLRPFMILDEGFAVLEGVVDVVPSPVAGIGIAEKGYLTLELTVDQEGGHASMPAAQTSIGILAGAIGNLETTPMPARLDGAAAEFFDELSREMGFTHKLLFANRWITSPILISLLGAQPSTAATLRTTTAVTTAQGGVAENVLPTFARATVNFRIHPSDRVQDVLDHVRRAIDDERVAVNTIGIPSEPSALSPAQGPAWDLLERTIRESYEGVIVAPTLVLGATDARHYAGLCEAVYRFNGIRLKPEDLSRIHGSNERITTKNYLEMIRFYRQLMANG